MDDKRVWVYVEYIRRCKHEAGLGDDTPVMVQGGGGEGQSTQPVIAVP